MSIGPVNPIPNYRMWDQTKKTKPVNFIRFIITTIKLKTKILNNRHTIKREVSIASSRVWIQLAKSLIITDRDKV